jgi:hypothetical protein
VFLMSPVIAGRLMGHYNLVVVWPFVCACMAWQGWWRRSDWVSGLLLGIAAGVLPFFDYYLSVYFLVFGVAWVVATMMRLETRRTPRSNRAPAFGAAAVAAAALVLAVVIALAGRDSFTVAGLRISTRSPGAARPCVRCIFVFAPNSSRNTRSATRRPANFSNHADRLATTSGRSCSAACVDFFFAAGSAA